MHPARVLWFGSTRAFAPRRLAAEGFTVEVVRRLPESGDVDVCVVATGDVLRAVEVAVALPGAKVIALVPEARDVASALAAGAHDAIAAAAAEVELPARVRIWARAAHTERQLVAGHQALVARTRRLEALLVESEQARSGLAALAHTDELTGLGNRRSFVSRLGLALEYSARYGGAVSVVLVDLDGMKQLNDACGHAAGDAALVRVGEIVQAAVRSVDHAARLGGGTRQAQPGAGRNEVEAVEAEFGVVLPATPAAAAVAVAERIRDLVGAILPIDGVRLSASLGVAAAGPGMTADSVLERADLAMYAAKRGGKNRVERAA